MASLQLSENARNKDLVAEDLDRTTCGACAAANETRKKQHCYRKRSPKHVVRTRIARSGQDRHAVEERLAQTKLSRQWGGRPEPQNQ